MTHDEPSQSSEHGRSVRHPAPSWYREIPEPVLILKQASPRGRDRPEQVVSLAARRASTPASAARDDTPSFSNAWREVGLDGLLAEEELGRDLPVGLARHHEPGDLQLPTREPRVPRRHATPPSRDPPPQSSQLARRLVGVAHGAARGELRLCPLQHVIALVPPARGGERLTLQGPRLGGGDTSTDLVLDVGRLARRRHRLVPRRPGRAGRGPGPERVMAAASGLREVSRASARRTHSSAAVDTAEGQLGSRQGLVAEAPLPDAGQREVRAATPLQEVGTAPLGIAGFQARQAERRTDRGGDPRIPQRRRRRPHPPHRSGQRCRGRHESLPPDIRYPEPTPGTGRFRRGERSPRRCHDVGRLADVAPDAEDKGTTGRHQDVLALSRGPGQGDAAFQVPVGVVEAPEEDLRPSQEEGRLDAIGQLLVRQRVDELGGPVECADRPGPPPDPTLPRRMRSAPRTWPRGPAPPPWRRRRAPPPRGRACPPHRPRSERPGRARASARQPPPRRDREAPTAPGAVAVERRRAGRGPARAWRS